MLSQSTTWMFLKYEAFPKPSQAKCPLPICVAVWMPRDLKFTISPPNWIMLAWFLKWLNMNAGQYPTSSPDPNCSHQCPCFGSYITYSKICSSVYVLNIPEHRTGLQKLNRYLPDHNSDIELPAIVRRSRGDGCTDNNPAVRLDKPGAEQVIASGCLVRISLPKSINHS